MLYRLALLALTLLLSACGGSGGAPSLPIPEAQASAPSDGCPVGDATAQFQGILDSAKDKVELPPCVFNITSVRVSKPLRIVCSSATVNGTIIRSSGDEGVIVDPAVVVNIPTGGWNQRGYWFSSENCRYEPAVRGGGKHGLVLRPRKGFFISSSLIWRNHFGGFGAQGLYLDNSALNESGGIFSTKVVDNFIEGGVLAENIGDSVQFIDNVVPDQADANPNTAGFDISFISGAAEGNLIRNNITKSGGCILIRNGEGVGLLNNWCESASKPAGGSIGLIQVNNCDSCTVRDNRVQTLGGSAPYALAFDGGRGNEIASNKLNLGTAGHIALVNTSAKLSGFNRFYGGADITVGKVAGAATGLLTTP